MDGETEINNFLKVWILSIASIYYCYYVSARIQRGFARIFTLLPIFYLFVTLPLKLSSIHLGAPTAIFIVWLANVKLLLFAFDNGPLFSKPPLPLLHSISIALLPITLKNNPFKKRKKEVLRPLMFLAFKVAPLAVIVSLYDYKPYLHQNFILALCFSHLFFGIELLLEFCAFLVQVILGLELQPQSNKPYLATSLQDFWGRRWNLHVSSILRLTVYNPMRQFGTDIFPRKWVRPLAIFMTFLVSGIMHEICVFYLTRIGPTFEVTCFFVLHGMLTAVEVVAKPAVVASYRLHRVVAVPLTIGFMAATFAWVFLPFMVRHSWDLKLTNEYSIFSSFLRKKITSFFSYF